MKARVANHLDSTVSPVVPPRKKSNARRHLAIFVYDLSGGGAERQAVTFANEFAARGHDVDLVVVLADGPIRTAVSSAVRLVALNPWWSSMRWARKTHARWPVGALPALVSYLRRARPEVLLSAANHVNRAAPLAHYMAGVPTRLVLRVSNHLTWRGAPLQRMVRWTRTGAVRMLYPWADDVIAVSSELSDEVIGLTGMPPERVSTIHSAVVDSELRRKMRATPEHPWLKQPGPPVILAAARLRLQKDFPTLLRAFARVRLARSARLLILGEGSQRRHLCSLADRLGISADVDMPGFVINPYAFMARASVFVLSSGWEGLPATIIEALACGCPVVSTDCPTGPAEILQNGVFGRLVPVGDDAALAEAIMLTLDNPPDREHLRARAQEFAIDRAVDRYLEVMFGKDSRQSVSPEGTSERDGPVSDLTIPRASGR